jgi:hypothetical protein
MIGSASLVTIWSEKFSGHSKFIYKKSTDRLIASKSANLLEDSIFRMTKRKRKRKGELR